MIFIKVSFLFNYYSVKRDSCYEIIKDKKCEWIMFKNRLINLRL